MAFSSPPDRFEEANQDPLSPTRRQPYHLPSRVLASSPPPSRSNTVTSLRTPTRGLGLAVGSPAPSLTLTPPAPSTPSRRHVHPHHHQQQQYSQHHQQFQQRLQNDHAELYELASFPLPPSPQVTPSSYGSPRLQQSPYLSPQLPQEATTFANRGSPRTPPRSPSRNIKPLPSPYLQPGQYSPSPNRQSPSIPAPHTLSSGLSPTQRIPSPTIGRSGSPKPLLLPSSNHQTHGAPSWDSHHAPRNSPQMARPYQSPALLPSAMPGPDIDDPFREMKSPIATPPDTAATAFSKMSDSPPVTPHETDAKSGKKSKKPAGPPPLFKPSLGLMFTLSTRRDKLCLLLPACIFSIGAGAIPPLMTFVLGEAFDLFADYQTSLGYQSTLPDAVRDMKEANDALRTGMTGVAVKLIILGLLAVTLITASISLWVWHGELIAKRLRHAVYVGVVSKPMAWFDLGMGRRGAHVSEDAEDPDAAENESSGGLMGRFASEIDDIRTALASAAGRFLTCICTIIACLIVAFYHSYQLTLVMLGSAPIIVAITVIVEVLVTPFIMAERATEAAAASRVERATSAISTVKAFNAEEYEIHAFTDIISHQRVVYNKMLMLWGFRAGATQFLMLTIFVTGFWFGNWQVINGKKTAGDVTIVFWTTLLAASNMQMTLPMMNQLDKAKIAMAALLETAHEVPDTLDARPLSTADSLKTITDRDNKPSSPPQSPTALAYLPVQLEGAKKGRHRRATSKIKRVRELKKINPGRFTGELALHNVTFYYPSRPAPAPPALDKVTMYLPARDTTYIVGGSGSGKSTIGALLLGLYKIESGRIEADEQGIEWLDQKWLRGHVGMVSQGASVIFDGTVHDNIALGVVGSTGSRKKRPEEVIRAEVIQACKIALFHDFVKDLPDGYETILSGVRGASLSGGQRQRLALARAYLRDPTVLILDEATSALDIVSRSLVHEAIKKWRKNRTTIIITHDLSPITKEDFVYVMRDGQVVEQGYRRELESHDGSWFSHLAQVQEITPVQPTDNFETQEEVLGVPEFMLTPSRPKSLLNRFSSSPVMPFTASSEDLGGSLRELQDNRRTSRMFMDEQQQRRLNASPNPSMRSAHTPPMNPSASAIHLARSVSSQNIRPLSIHMTPPLSYSAKRSSALYGVNSSSSMHRHSRVSIIGGLNPSASIQSLDRANKARDSFYQLKEVTTSNVLEEQGDPGVNPSAPAQLPIPSLLQLFKILIPMVPSKTGLVVGLALAIGSGICTPMFSNQFSQLLAALGTPGSANVLRIALVLLLIAAIDGLAQWGKFTILHQVNVGWVFKLQKETFRTVIVQDKAWYDDPKNIPINLVSALVKDANEAREVIGNVAGSLFTVAAMILLGVIWACVAGWQLALVGLAMLPLFVLITALSSHILNKCESINKQYREECARRFFTAVSNVKAVKAMSLEPVLLEKFEKSVAEAYAGGKKAALPTGVGIGISFFMVYAAQVGALFIIKGWYTFPQVMQVFVLLIFSITFASQVLQTLPQLTKVKYAVAQLLRLHAITNETAESQGRMTFPISGRIVFDKVSFQYPSRPDAPVLKDVCFEVQPGECVAIVGPSGSGKSTIAALLQRLYEPSSGMIRIDGRPTARTDVNFLRDHVAVVSQHPNLFDMTIADNIAYGRKDVPLDEIIKAAKAANVHGFIMTLPHEYKTNLGENAGLISGGQAQRLQIARALLKPREILLGDEITSALDAENQEIVMKTITDVKDGRTTVLITHTLATMQICDRLIVMDEGRVVQQGTFRDLQADTKGVFATLTRGGEWNT